MLRCPASACRRADVVELLDAINHPCNHFGKS
jgi:hypothetical protein